MDGWSPFAIYLYGPAASPLPSRFEEAARRLDAIDRLHFEWDGSFVWRGGAEDRSWQLDGMLYDLGEQIQYVDLKGCCPLESWRELLEIFTGGSAGGGNDVLILRLPQRQECDRQAFEEEVWGNPSPPEQLA